MKILNLHFKNINSLEGESRIDFQQNPLANAGVFAIVGPNGSGKSSILDAISLAFYGETFRFDRPAEHVMTAHTAESFAQVEFALGGQKFRTRWQVQRKDNQSKGELLAPQMQLVALRSDGEQLLEETTQAVSDKITEIIGMDFRNFSRSIMLAQGDFAAFLNALDSERMDILEKMNSSDIYEVSKQELRDQTATAQTVVEQTRQELLALPVMDDVALEAAEHDLLDFREQVREFKQQQNAIQEQLAWTQNITALKNQAQNLEKNQRQTNEQLKQKISALEKVNAVQSVLVFKEDIAAINELQSRIKQNHNSCKIYNQEIGQIKEQLASFGVSAVTKAPTQNIAEQKQVIDDLKHQVSQLKLELGSQTSLQLSLTKQINEKQALQAATLRWLENHSADKSLLDHFPNTVRLRELRAEIIELDAQQQLFTKQLKASDQSLKKNISALEQSKSKCLNYEQQLQEAENEVAKILQDSSLTELESLLIFQQQRISDFEELYALARVNQKVSSGGFFSFFSKKSDEEEVVDLEALKKQADDLADQIAHAKNIRNVLEKAVLNEALVQRLRHERPYLADGQPCPLCGSLDHPYAKMIPNPADSRQALTNQKIRLQELTSRADIVARQIARAEKATEDAVIKNKNIEKTRFEFNVLGNKLNVGSQEFGIQHLSNLKKALQQEKTELNDIQTLLKRHAQQQDKISKLKLQIDKEQATIKQLSDMQGQLSSDTGIIPTEMQDIQAALEKCRAEEKILAEEVLGQLAALGEAMPEKGQDEALVERLTTRRRDYYTHVLRDKALTEELEPLRQKAALGQQKIEQYTERLNGLLGQLQAEESVGPQLALLEKQKLLLEQEMLLNNLQQQLRSMEQAFETKLTNTQFNSFKQVEEALGLMATQDDLRQEINALQEQAEQIKQKVQDIQALLAAEEALALTKSSAAELEVEQRRVGEKLSIASDEVKTLESKLAKQAGYHDKQTLLKAQLEEQQKQLAELQTQLRFSEENGMVFRRQVQQKMIGQLLSHTNKMLEKISGRYYLRQLPTEQGLALEIEDTLQQNVRRQPKSLSGGETFLISLALALGLSELANNGKAVDSLFLDEGFGNLDPDALTIVVNTLQSLRMQGKTVGVISHVEAVKKRIKTRIEMVKKPNGLSQLKKVS